MLAHAFDDDPKASFDDLVAKPPVKRAVYKVAGPVTQRFHDSRALIRMLRGPIGSGKTFAAWREVFTRAFNMPVGDDGVARCYVIAARRTYRILKTSTIQSFWQALPAAWAAAGTFNKADMEFLLRTKIRRGDGEVTMVLKIQFLTFDSDKSLAQFKGAEFNVLYLNEAVEMNAMALQMGLSRLGRFPASVRPEQREDYVILDTNSFDPAHPLYPFFYDAAVIKENAAVAEMPVADFVEVFDYPSALSPEAENLENLGADYYQKKMAGQTQQYIDVMIKNKFGAVSDGRPCYGAFRADLHASEYIAPDKDKPIFAGIDFGRDPAVVICQEDDEGNVVVVDAEYRLGVEGATGIKEMLGVFAAKYSPTEYRWVTGAHDPAGAARTQVYDVSPETMLAHFAAQFGVCKTERAVTNNVADRIEIVNKMFSEIGTKRIPQLRISYDRNNRGLLWLIRACSKYKFAKIQGDSGVTDRHRDAPHKDEFSHIAEALGYSLLRPNGGAREKLKYHPGQPKPIKVPRMDLSPFNRG